MEAGRAVSAAAAVQAVIVGQHFAEFLDEGIGDRGRPVGVGGGERGEVGRRVAQRRRDQRRRQAVLQARIGDVHELVGYLYAQGRFVGFIAHGVLRLARRLLGIGAEDWLRR